jgi:hypothetical protein
MVDESYKYHRLGTGITCRYRISFSKMCQYHDEIKPNDILVRGPLKVNIKLSVMFNHRAYGNVTA